MRPNGESNPENPVCLYFRLCAILALAWVAVLQAAPPALAQGSPWPPTLASVTAGDGQATLNWTYSLTPAAFQWRSSTDGGTVWSRWSEIISGEARSHTVDSLEAGTTYTFQVRAGYFRLEKSTVEAKFVPVYRPTEPSNSITVTITGA